ncbi:hypothetical protein PVZ92_03625 [Bordetella pertussis]|uniref:hypothetical protein n=1 Tax=Bordetella pertussis TaxID=520 RepID=UPI0013966ED3|nr:hypothetical protein [Bordetella pertussis]WNQ57268.1 hypothetical protein PVZ92_03625 [Bordetella pertussis]
MNWGVGDFQFLKSGSDEPCIQPIESSQLIGNGWRNCAPCTTRARHPRNSSSG